MKCLVYEVQPAVTLTISIQFNVKYYEANWKAMYDLLYVT